MSAESTIADEFRAEAATLRRQQIAATTNDRCHEYARRASFLEAAAALLDQAMGEVYIGSNCPMVNVQANQFHHVGIAYSAKPSGEPLFSQVERYEALRAMGLTAADDLFTDERVKERGVFLNEPIQGVVQPKPKKTTGKTKPKPKRKTTAA